MYFRPNNDSRKQFKSVIVLGRKISTCVTLRLHELIDSRWVYFQHVPHELSHSVKSHPSWKSQNSASAKYEEYRRPINLWIIQETPHGENLPLEENRMPDDRVLDTVQGTKALLSEQDTNSRKIDPHRKQIIRTHWTKKTTKNNTFLKGINYMLNYRCIFVKAYQQGST